MAPVAEAKHTNQCFGVAYYDAWRRTHGLPPVCVGFSQQKESVQAASGSSPEQHPPSNDKFKVLCLGYSAHDAGSKNGDLPYCEGLELVLIEQASEAAAAHNASAGQMAAQSHASVAHESAAPHAHSAHAERSAGLQQQGEQDAQEVPDYLVFKLISRANQNMEKLRSALKNEGPLRLKPTPANLQDMADRLSARASANAAKVMGTAGAVASNAFSLVKPLFGSSASGSDKQ